MRIDYQIQIQIDRLPADLKRQALDYVRRLARAGTKKSRVKKFKFDWAGGLSNLKSRYSSVELQHQANDWR
jgi:hypothetical protein